MKKTIYSVFLRAPKFFFAIYFYFSINSPFLAKKHYEIGKYNTEHLKV